MALPHRKINCTLFFALFGSAAGSFCANRFLRRGPIVIQIDRVHNHIRMAAAAVTEAVKAANWGDVFEAAEVSDAAAEATDDARFCCCDTFDEG